MTVVEADVIVVGAGSVGSMAGWQLAARGLRVVGIGRFTIPGPFSAYAGESRVFRMVYFEGGHYTPLLQRARALWRELEAASGTSLLNVTGVVTITEHDHPDHAALLRAGREQGLSFEIVSGDEARRRLPQHVIGDGDVAVLDPAGGFVRSEHAVFAALQPARPLTWDPRHLDAVQALVRASLPALDPRPVRAVLCADGYPPDEAGLLGPVPGRDGVVVATGFSGHGFKMASSRGAVAADLIAAGTTATDVSFLNPARFLPPGQELTGLPLGGASPGSEPPS